MKEPSLHRQGIASFARRFSDEASVMPDISGRHVVMGFWHNWRPEPGQGYQQGRFAEMPLTAIPDQYNVVAVAFMKVMAGGKIPTFRPYNFSDSEFRRQIGALNGQGRVVLISLGGADAHIEMQVGQEEPLAMEIIRLVETYGFDGLDIDLEQSAITAGDNRTVIPAALRLVKDHYRDEGKHFIISMAPEFPYLRENVAYLQYISGLEGYYDFIAPQYYNQAGDGLWVDEISTWLTQNDDARKEDFLYYLTDSIVHGTRGFARIPHDKFAIGLPSNVDAAANGYVIAPEHATRALERLSEAGTPIRGLMTWSINWDNGTDRSDRAYDWEFIKRYGFLSEGGGIPEKPTVPANLTSPRQTRDSIDLEWQASTGPHPVERYIIYRDGQSVGISESTVFTDIGLQTGRKYRYQVSARDTQGNESALGAGLMVSTQGGSLPAWQSGKRYRDGDQVQCQALAFTCVMVHTANPYWTPDKATSLWQRSVRLELRR